MEFCSYCKTKIEIDSPHCSNCGISLYASEDEKSKYITNIHRTREKFIEASSATHRAKWVLFVIGFASLFFHFFLLYLGKIELADFIFLGGLSGLVVVAGFLTNDYPIPSVIVGIIFVVGIYAYQFYIDLDGLFKGIIWKIVIFSSLIYALKSAIEFEKMIEN
jgi:hypothetical protein